MAKNFNRSLGGLRKNPYRQNNPKCPDGTGRILFHKDLIQELYSNLQRTKAEKVEATLACWPNETSKKNGGVDKFMTIEVKGLSAFDKPWWDPSDNPEYNSLEEFFRS